MTCEKCGAALELGAVFCAQCGASVSDSDFSVISALEEQPAGMPVFRPEPVAAPAASRPAVKKIPKEPWKPHIALRISMQFLSFVLCVILCASLLATVLIADLNRVVSAGGMKQIISTALTVSPAPQRLPVSAGALGVRLDDVSANNMRTSSASEENVSALVDWLYETIQQSAEQPLDISKAQMQSFVEQSTMDSFLADKLASYTEDFINDTANTTITTQEIMDVLEENAELIEQEFQIEITEEVKAQINTSVEQAVEKNDINTVIREQVFEAVEQTINESMADTGVNMDGIRAMLKTLTAENTVKMALGVCLAVMVMLLALNFYNIPAGLTWIAVPCILVGGILVLPLVALPMLQQMLPAVAMQLVDSFVGVISPIHYGVLILGAALLITGIVWRAIRATIRKER